MSNRKGLLLAIGVILLGVIITASSYAFWSWTSNSNKAVSFNTAKALRNYIIYDEGDSQFSGDFKVSNSYTGGIHSTITISKTSEAANIDMVAIIHMDINQIGNNMKSSPALKWQVTLGDSTNPGTTLASGNFIGANSGDTLDLLNNIEVTTTPTQYTIWIWLDSSMNPSDALSGETLDTNVWTEINQIEGVEDRFEITRISANYQNISATVVDSKYKVTHYAVVSTGSSPSSWTSIGTASNIYNLNTTVNAAGTYDVYFKDENNRTTHKSVVVGGVDTTAPSCTFGSFIPAQIADSETARIELTCTDSESDIAIGSLTTNDFTKSNNNITITSISRTAISHGYSYTITVTGTQNDGTTAITLPANKVRNGVSIGNAAVTSSAITVANTYTISFNSMDNHCTLDATTYANKTPTYGTVVNIPNPSCVGFAFDGWTASNTLDTANAKYGDTNNPTNTWSNGSNPVTATYFKDLANVTDRVITLSANWTKTDNTAPTLTVATSVSGTTFSQNKTATITLSDNIMLKPGTYTIKYGWSTSALTCNDMSSTTSITVISGDTSKTANVTIDSYTGAGRLYVCNPDIIYDLVDNPLAAGTVADTPMYLDNTPPTGVVSVNASGDANLDGVINNKDVSRTNQIINGNETDPRKIACADVNLDGIVDNDTTTSTDGGIMQAYQKNNLAPRVLPYVSNKLSVGFDLDDDESGVVSYYFGTTEPNATGSNVTWTNASSPTDSFDYQIITGGGTYWLGVKDTAGNMLKTSKVFYTVTYNINGGTGTLFNQLKMTGSDVTLTGSYGLTKLGYTFSGWNTAANGSGTSYVSEGTYSANADVTLYAQWTGNTYTATFYYNSNSTNGSTTVASTTAQCTVSGNDGTCTATIPTAVKNSVGTYNNTYAGLSTSTGNMTEAVASGATSVTLSSDQTYYSLYRTAVTMYRPTSTSTAATSTFYRNQYFASTSALATTILSDSQTGTSNWEFVSQVTNWPSLYGYNTAVNKSSPTTGLTSVSALANSNKTTVYEVLRGNPITVTYYYNSSTAGDGTVTVATAPATSHKRLYCTTATTAATTNSIFTIPAVVTNSVGPYGQAYLGTARYVNTIAHYNNTAHNTNYYTYYQGEVTNYYYDGTSYASRTLYRSSVFTSTSAIKTVLAATNTGVTNYTTEAGPGGSSWAGLSTADDTTAEYATVELAANSTSGTLYTIYSFDLTYSEGANIIKFGTELGAGSESCKVTSAASCSVTLPSITPAFGATSVGWGTTNGASTGTAAGQTYTLNSSPVTLYANATLNSYTVTANATGGTISATTGWTLGSGNTTATKSITYDSTYGTLPTSLTKTGYTFAGWSLVPSGYQQVEYIQNSGNQYINTGVTPTNTLSSDIVYVDTTASGSNYVMGSRNSSSGNIHYAFSGASSGKKIAVTLGNSGQAFSITRVINNKYHIMLIPEYLSGSGYRAYGKLENITSGASDAVYTAYTDNGAPASATTLKIFAAYTTQIHNGYQLYSLKMYNNGTLAHRYIPCVEISTGKKGVYDIVDGAFYANAKTDVADFTAGSASYLSTSTVVDTAANHTIYANWNPNIYTITLDSTGSTTAGTPTIYEKYNTSICLNNDCSTVMTTSTNPITTPTKTGYVFQGYYDGNTQMIDDDGYITSSFDVNKYSAASTLTASWVDEAPPTGSLSVALNGSSISATITASDNGSGLKSPNPYGWYVSNSSTCDPSINGSFVDSANSSYSYTVPSSGTYYVCVRVTDAANNSSYFSQSVEKTGIAATEVSYTGTWSGVLEEDDDNWCAKLLGSGTLTFDSSGDIDVFMVGGGAAGARGTDMGQNAYCTGGAGGGGGATRTETVTVTASQNYSIVIGAGGAGLTSYTPAYDGDDTTAFGYTATGGTVGTGGSGTSQNKNGADGTAAFGDTSYLYGADGGGGGGADYYYQYYDPGTGGTSGGGDGGLFHEVGSSAAANSGSGGGGGWCSWGTGSGGSGIVIVCNANGGTHTVNGTSSSPSASSSSASSGSGSGLYTKSTTTCYRGTYNATITSYVNYASQASCSYNCAYTCSQNGNNWSCPEYSCNSGATLSGTQCIYYYNNTVNETVSTCTPQTQYLGNCISQNVGAIDISCTPQ